MAEAHNGIGVQLRSRGLLSEALEAFQHATAAKPDSLEYLYNVATTLRAALAAKRSAETLRRMIVLAANTARPF